MSVHVYLGSEALGPAAPEHLPAFLVMARGLALPWHQDAGALYIASPLAGRTVALTGPAAAVDALRRRLAAAGAQVGEARADVCLLLTPGPEAACFSLRRPLASRALAHLLADCVSFCPWLEAPAWCPTVHLCSDPATAPDALASRVVTALQRFLATPLPPLVSAAFSALLALPTAREAPAPPPQPSPPAPAPPAAPPPAMLPPSEVAPLLLTAPTTRDATPPPLPTFEPPGSGVIRVFTPRLEPSVLPPNARPFERNKQATPAVAPAFAISSSSPPAMTPLARSTLAKSPPAPNLRPRPIQRQAAPHPAPPTPRERKLPPDLHVFRITPGSRVPG